MELMWSYNVIIMFKSHCLNSISFSQSILVFFIIFFIFIITLTNGVLKTLNVKNAIIVIKVFRIL